MAAIWKRFGAWATALKSDLFTWARLKLTALYLLVIVVILVLYSAVLYSSVTQHLHDSIEGNVKEGIDLDSLFISTTDNLQTIIFVVDGLVIMIAAGISYWLAGYTLRPIRAALQAQTAFSADASHELRTPLAVMRSDIEVLLRGSPSLSPDIRKVLESNLEEIKSLSDMSGQLLELSRGNEAVKNNFETVELKEIVTAVAGKLTPMAVEQDIFIETDLQDDVFVIGQKSALERMVRNVVANAIFYNRRHGSVKVTVAADPRAVTVRVTDTGRGIDSKDLPHVFNRFYKADTARSSQIGGSGLGLAIVKQIVIQHHGTVKISSVVNTGTIVTISLPRPPKI